MKDGHSGDSIMSLLNSNKEWNRLSEKDGYAGNWKRFFCKHDKSNSVFREGDDMMEGMGFRECQNCGKTWWIK